MKTLPLSALIRQPARVKKLTAAGQQVRITDRGKPLWVLQPDSVKKVKPSKADADAEAFWRELDEMPPLVGPSTCQLLLESRR